MKVQRNYSKVQRICSRVQRNYRDVSIREETEKITVERGISFQASAEQSETVLKYVEDAQ